MVPASVVNQGATAVDERRQRRDLRAPGAHGFSALTGKEGGEQREEVVDAGVEHDEHALHDAVDLDYLLFGEVEAEAHGEENAEDGEARVVEHPDESGGRLGAEASR